MDLRPGEFSVFLIDEPPVILFLYSAGVST